MTSHNQMRSSCLLLIFCCVVVVGCGPRTGEPTQRPKPNEVPSARNIELRNDEQTPDVSRIEPGTELTEAAFKQTLHETGARFIVIQVYMEACGPCMTEALHLTEKEGDWRKSGVAIVGMGMDETPEGPKAFYRHTGERITYPLYLAPWFSEQQEVFATPTMFIYGADGDQLFRTDPETAEDGVMAALTTKLSQLLGAGKFAGHDEAPRK